MEKRVFCFLLALLMSGVCTACGERTAEPDPEVSPATPTAEIQPQPTETEPPGGNLRDRSLQEGQPGFAGAGPGRQQ